MEVKIQCTECKKWYIKEYGKHHRRLYCSPACKQRRYRRVEMEKGGSHDCVNCGEAIPKRLKFCSNGCQQEFQKPWKNAFRAFMKARAAGDLSLVPKLEEVLKDYID